MLVITQAPFDKETYQKQADFARMAFGDPSADVTRNRNFWSQSHATACGKMKALRTLLRSWKAKGSKVLLFSYSTQMLDILQDFVTRQGYSWLRLDGSTSTKQVRTPVALDASGRVAAPCLAFADAL